MSDFIIGNGTLGSNTGYTASGNCYEEAKREIENMLDQGFQPNVDRSTLETIQYVAGDFSYEDKKKLGL